MTLPARLVVRAIGVYQAFVAPFLPPACRFAPTCSEYARLAIAERGLVRGGWLAIRRLARCQPFDPGGYDPPPSVECAPGPDPRVAVTATER